MEKELIEKAIKVANKFGYSEKELDIKDGSHLPFFVPALVKIKDDKIELYLNTRSKDENLENYVAHELGHVKFHENHKKLFYFIQAVDFPINFGLAQKWYIRYPYFIGLTTLGLLLAPTLLAAYMLTASACYLVGEYGANREARKRGFRLGWEYVL